MKDSVTFDSVPRPDGSADVLWVSEYPPTTGGISDYSDELVNELSTRDLQIHVLSESGSQPDSATSNVTVVGTTPRSATEWMRVLGAGYENVVVQLPGVDLSGLTLVGPQARWHTNLICVAHEPPTAEFQFTAFTFDHYAFLSEFAESVFRDRFKWPLRLGRATTSQLPYFGIDENIHTRVAQPDAAADISADRLVVCPGFITERKRYHLAADALTHTNADDIHVVFAGGVHRNDNDAYLTELQRRVADSGLEGSVTFTGMLSEAEVNGWLSAADIALLPYEHIYQSSVLVKAIALNTYPVVAGIPGLQKLVEIYGGDVLDTVTAEEIAHVLTSGQYGDVATEKLLEDLSWEANASAYESLLH
jgi:glycosyltransferase involved in cell wall biosynthesis